MYNSESVNKQFRFSPDYQGQKLHRNWLKASRMGSQGFVCLFDLTVKRTRGSAHIL